MMHKTWWWLGMSKSAVRIRCAGNSARSDPALKSTGAISGFIYQVFIRDKDKLQKCIKSKKSELNN